MKSRALLAVTNERINQLIEPVLKKEGFDVSQVSEGNEALRRIQADKPELIILDKKFPEIGGIYICKSVRMEPSLAETAIIMLDENEDRAARFVALDAGVDDYFVWPFNMEALIARIKYLQRKYFPQRNLDILRVDSIEMDLGRWIVYLKGKPVNLTVKEYKLLKELIEVKGRVLTRETLLTRVWGHEQNLDIQTRTVDVHIGRLRSKLGTEGKKIITVRNIGYRIDISPDWIKH